MAKILNILTHPNKFLRQKTRDLDNDEINSHQTQSFIDDLVLTMDKKDGIGLAAIQVGNDLSICAINTKDQPLVLINPKITYSSIRKSTTEEGCLSIPGVYKNVTRPKIIKISALDKTGKPLNMKMKGMLARVAQHEIDHLNGVLFIDKAK